VIAKNATRQDSKEHKHISAILITPPGLDKRANVCMRVHACVFAIVYASASVLASL